MTNDKKLDEWELKVLSSMCTDKILSLSEAIDNTDRPKESKLFKETMDEHIHIRKKLRTQLNDL